ncbi:PREDICTED: uncharacterized protein LOC104767797 [Camelina sativa]|uniref:Uncharacterized protein LOC104767797 n=1 Tax=Camelina sativa TaxID=90675 RepID=A0ABM0XRX5_CAMSA|nr:PREDICTED: uncharacterized protein LOC104767797 [Camelina sativa]
MSIVESSEKLVLARVDDGVNPMHIIVVYADPTPTGRCGIWDKLSEVIEGISESFMVGGDFNIVVRLDERSGGNGRLSPDSLEHGSLINANSLIDMGFKGYKFTGRRGRVVHNYVAKFLNRMSPEVQCDPRRRPFRFEAAWLSHLEFKDMLASSWDIAITTQLALQRLTVTLKKWNYEAFGDIQRRKERLSASITRVQDQLELDCFGGEEYKVFSYLHYYSKAKE